MKLWMVVCLLPSLCLAQPDFRADVRLVNVSFSVRDSRGSLVTGLTRDDFELLEDGVPQKIAFFARSQDVPLTLGLVVDISGSQGSFLKPHEKDLRTFLHAALAPQDRAFLVCFANHIRLVADYSKPDRDLAAALMGFDRLRDVTEYPELGPKEIRTAGTAFYDAIYYATVQMLANAEGGRKALVIFSDGEDNSSAHHMLDAIETAQTNNVLLFCVRYTEVHNQRPNARNKYGASVMARIARETGGVDYDARERALAEDFKEIGDQLRSAYDLGFHSSHPASDDTFHKISIRPKDTSLTVRAKTGYYAPGKSSSLNGHFN
ncbi:MAG TPA: VWA domain-containing protein [Bryobacteraceae bacterium]|jgi:Ca-activated chloride channel family protein|nr:VWA domain-containing protein [Bryobacteraceae bacterium]